MVLLAILAAVLVVVYVASFFLREKQKHGAAALVLVAGFALAVVVYLLYPHYFDVSGSLLEYQKHAGSSGDVLDPTYEFWTPDEDTCKNIAHPTCWCLKAGDLEKIENWLLALPTGWSRVHVWSRSSSIDSFVKSGYMWRFTDHNMQQKTSQMEIAHMLIGVFGEKTSSDVIYVAVIPHPDGAPRFSVTFDEVRKWAAEKEKTDRRSGAEK